MPFFISEPTESGWRMKPEEFIALLKARWPSAKISPVKNPLTPSFSHEWAVRDDALSLEGSFNSADSAVVLDGSLEDSAKFAAWFRSVVPEKQKLLFYDQSFESQVRLAPGITEKAILAAFNPPDDS